MELSRGVVLMAWGKRGYGFAAFNIAVSLKHHSPDVPIHLIASRETLKQVGDTTVFDSIHWTDEMVSDPGRFKASLYGKLPFDYNLYLDVDALCVQDIQPLFDRLIEEGGNYYTFINAVYDHSSPSILPQMYWAFREDIWDHYSLGTEHKLPATQSSAQFIKKCEESRELFALVEACFDNPIPLDRLRNQWGGSQPDELYLNVALTLLGISPHIGDDVLWFCNNGNKKPHQVKAEYYLMSFFGYRGNIKPKFWEFYDKNLIHWCSARGHNHNFKSGFIRDDKHANTLPKGRPARSHRPPAIPINRSETMSRRKIHINLFTSFYQTGNPKRDGELIQVMQRNIACQSIGMIYNLGSHYGDEKVLNIKHDRPLFSDFIQQVNAFTSPDHYNIICNGDIYFEDSITDIQYIDFENRALTLSRYDTHRGRPELFDYEYSQDTWIFRGQIKPIGDANYPLGKPGVDNRFAYELAAAGYSVANPALSIRTFHLHNQNVRSYTEADRITGNYLPVKPTSWDGVRRKKLLIHQPGKVGDILICLPIARYYDSLGFDVFWQCPAIYHHMFNYVDYATPIVQGQGSFDRTIDLSFGIIQQTVIHSWWLKNKSRYPSFVHAKYEQAGVDKSERYNLHYTRDLEKEQELSDMIPLEKFALVHDRSDYGSRPEISTYLPIVRFAPVAGFSIFDWRKVIERASEIHCIDSSLANFVEVIRPEGKCFFYRVPERQTESWFDFSKWELIDMNQMVSA